MSKNEIIENQEELRPDDLLAFSRIKDEIEVKAKQTAETIISDANNEAEKIVAAAKDKATKISSEILAVANREANNNKLREISSKKLAIKMDYLKIREELFDEIQLEAKSKLLKFTQSSEYKDYLVDLIRQSAASIGDGNLVLMLRKEDKSILTKDELKKISDDLSKDLGTKIKISIDKNAINILGGIKLLRDDNRIFVDNTFETKLSRANDQIRSELLKIIS